MTRGESYRDTEREAAALGWMAQANCAGVETRLMFPVRGESTREARAVCAACVVREQCLEYALDNHETFGIWGGLSERERRRIRKARRTTVASPPPGEPLCRVPECGRKAVRGADLCSGHRNRLYTKGDVLAHIPLRPHQRRTAPAEGAA